MGSSQLQYTILPGSVKDMGVYLFIRQGSVSMSGGASPLTFWGVCDKCMFHISNGNQIYITLHKRRFFFLSLTLSLAHALSLLSLSLCECVLPPIYAPVFDRLWVNDLCAAGSGSAQWAHGHVSLEIGFAVHILWVMYSYWFSCQAPAVAPIETYSPLIDHSDCKCLVSSFQKCWTGLNQR